MITRLSKQFMTDEVGPLMRLAFPLIVTGLVEASIGFFSTIFLARLGPNELAAGALVSWLFATLMVVLWGTLTAVSVLVAQKYGEKNELAIAQILRDGLMLSAILVVPTFLLLWHTAPIFLLFGQKQTLVILAESYLHGLAWGVLPDFVLLVLLQFLIGLGHTRTSMTFMLCWVPIAVFCNYVLIFGVFGLPRLGIAGIGWGMTLSYWLISMCLIVYLLLNKIYQSYLYAAWSFKAPFYLKELLQIGVPMGAMYCIEVGFFLALTLLMGLINEASLAANQIVLQYLGMLIAVIFSIAQAVTVRMGHILGQKNKIAAKRVSYAGIAVSLLFMSMVLVAYWVFPERLISIDLDVQDAQNASIVIYAKQFFIICAIFQLFEAVRITLFGALRAFKDTNFTLLTSVISFWLIALPIGYGLTHTALGSVGLWWGMLLGAASSVSLLSLRLMKM